MRAQMDAALDPPSPPLPRRPPAAAQVDVGGELEHRSRGGGEHRERGSELEVGETGMELEDDEPGYDDEVAMDDAGVEEDKGAGGYEGDVAMPDVTSEEEAVGGGESGGEVDDGGQEGQGVSVREGKKRKGGTWKASRNERRRRQDRQASASTGGEGEMG